MRLRGFVMLIKCTGANPSDKLPTEVQYVVGEDNITIRILASENTIDVAKVMKNFRDGKNIPKDMSAKGQARKDIVYSLGAFLFREAELEALKPVYVFTLEQLLEL